MGWKRKGLRSALPVLLFGIPAVLHAQTPELPVSGFISGRAATQPDVRAGNAIFAIGTDGSMAGEPLSVAIPQYAFWSSAEAGKVLVVVVQAEGINGLQLFGFRDSDGNEYVATGPEIELLGTTPPP